MVKIVFWEFYSNSYMTLISINNKMLAFKDLNVSIIYVNSKIMTSQLLVWLNSLFVYPIVCYIYEQKFFRIFYFVGSNCVKHWQICTHLIFIQSYSLRIYWQFNNCLYKPHNCKVVWLDVNNHIKCLL